MPSSCHTAASNKDTQPTHSYPFINVQIGWGKKTGYFLTPWSSSNTIPMRINHHLRPAFFEFVQNSANVMPANRNEIIWDLPCLMELLEVAEDERGRLEGKRV